MIEISSDSTGIRTALVTGANRGIGLAIATGLAKLGYNTLLAARNLSEANEAAKQIGATGVGLDVTNKEQIANVHRRYGDIDVLVNNAGVLFDGPMLDDPEGFEQSMQVMVQGPYHLIRTFAPGMIRRKYGRIVNVSSNWGSFGEGLGGPNAYGVAKAALNALTLKASRELPKTVKINAMCPGWVRTRMGGSSAELTPKQGADTAIWLATLADSGPTGGFFQGRKPMKW